MGEFTFTIEDINTDLAIKVEATGLATRTFWADYRPESNAPRPEAAREWIIDPTGRIGKPLRMGPGVFVTGRVVQGGNPVPGVTMVLQYCTFSPRKAESAGHQFQNSREAKTDEAGYFRMPHVAAGQDLNYAISAKPGSLQGHQTVIPSPFQAPVDGKVIDLGHFEVRPGRTLAGRLIFSDGNPPPPDARLDVEPEFSGTLHSGLDADGRFEVTGIPDGSVKVYIRQVDESGLRSLTLPGYRLSPKNKCLDPKFRYNLQGMVDRDIRDLTILLEPGETPRSADGVDPTLVAKFNEAKSGPITGVPPGALPEGR